MEKTEHVAEYKKKIVEEIVKHCKEYPIIALVDMENLPAPQLQAMKAKLRDKVTLLMTKKRLIRIAFEQADKDKKGIKELKKHFKGMPAILFTEDNPFKLNKTLQNSKSFAPAKAGQEAPFDIVIPAGPTSFAPGPIISELSSIGLKTGVESGKVAIKEDSTVAKKGDKISSKLAEVLARMDIEPMEVGLDLVAAYEDGIIYSKDILSIDETEFMNKLNSACSGAFNLAMFVGYPTKDTINTLISKAFNEAKALGLSQNIIDKGIIEELLAKAEGSMLSLKNTANIKVQEKPAEGKPKTEEKKEKPKVEKKEEVKEESKPKPKEEVPKEEPKIEEKKPKEKPAEDIKKEEKKIEKIEKKEEEVLEKDKEIIKEEQKIEQESKSKEESLKEKEVTETVKEEEEKKLEKERVELEEKFEELEKKKAGKKEKREGDVDTKIKKMVEDTKKHEAGERKPTANDLIKEADKFEVKEEKKVEVKKETKKDEVPSTHELAKRKAEKEMKEVEELAKKLQQKGTLRK